MIPCTPILLAASALAMARQGARVARRHPDIPCSLEFVTSLGRTTHFDLRLGRSSFPITAIETLAALHALAQGRGWTRRSVAPGDLLLTGLRARGDEPGAIPELSVVLEVAEVRGDLHHPVQRCTLVTARADPVAPHALLRVVECVQWCDAGHDDVAIRWYAQPEEFEAAA